MGHKPNPSKSLVQSHYYANGTEKYSYSVVQGSLGNSYDIVLAFKQKNTYSSHSPTDLSRQISSSREFNDTESKVIIFYNNFYVVVVLLHLKLCCKLCVLITISDF